MKRFLISTLTVLMSMGVLVPVASATQIALNDAVADHNSDGVVSLHEVVTENRERRNHK